MTSRAVAARVRTLARIAAIALAGGDATAQIVTENAGVLSPQTPELHELLTYVRGSQATELVATQELIVGLTRVDEIKVSLPFAWRDFETGAGDADFSGLGDATLRYKRALWRADDVMTSDRWSLLASITPPTGESTTAADGIPIPYDLRTSRGDWTLGLGTAYAHIADRHRFAAELTYRDRTAHDGSELGSSLDLDLAYWYRLSPAAFDELDATTEVRGVLELLTSRRSDSTFDGADADDGGTLSWLAPGLQVFPSDWCLLQANVSFPLVDTVDDSFGERRFGALLSVKFLF